MVYILVYDGPDGTWACSVHETSTGAQQEATRLHALGMAHLHINEQVVRP